MHYLRSFVLTLILVSLGVTGAFAQEDMEHKMGHGIEKAVALLHPTDGSEVHGTVTFTRVENGVRVQAEVMGFDKDGKHGFHIHEYGDCTAADGTSAGGHFNPQDMKHAGPMDDMRHIGDMGNLEVKNGKATMDYIDPKITMEGVNSILGRGVIVHKGEDDLESQPTGAAGPRAACGVIGVMNTE